MEFIKKSLTLNQPLKKGVAEFGVDGDIIVPDVLPDILKVLQVDGCASLSSCDVSDGKAYCEGKVDLKILYIPDEDNSKIKSITTSFDFSHTIGNAPSDTDCFADLSVDVSKVDFRLTNSRKLRVKSIINMNYAFLCPEKTDIAVDADEEDRIELKKEKAKICSFVDFKDTQFLVRESLELPSGQTSVCDLLKVDASVYETEYKVMSGRVVLKGICGVCALYTDLAGCVKYSDFEIPFTEIVELEAATEDCICDTEFCVKDVSCRAEADSDGEVRIIVADIIVGVKINAYEKTDVEYINDCYCPGKCLTYDSQEKTVEGIVAEGSITAAIRDVIVPDRNAPSLTGIYSLIARPVVESAKPENGRVCVEGKLVCYCLYVCGDDEVPVYNTMREIRFCENIDAEGCMPGCSCSVKAEITHKNYALNSAGETEIKASLGIDVIVTKEIQLPVIENVDVCERSAENKKGIVICFVRGGDTLWDVAKHYAVSASAISELNGLESEELCDGMKLLIPSI